MAVDGNGFFIVQAPNGSTYYTRNGTFSENSKGQIVDSTGQNVVQGYPLNSAGIATAGTPSAITLNTGAIAPQATTTADLTANLNSNVTPQVTSTIPSGSKVVGTYITSSVSSGSDKITVASAAGFTSGEKILIGNGDGTTNLYTISGITGNTITLSNALNSSVLANTAVSQNTLPISNLSTSGILSGYDIQINANNNNPTNTTTTASTSANTTATFANPVSISVTSVSGFYAGELIDIGGESNNPYKIETVGTSSLSVYNSSTSKVADLISSGDSITSLNDPYQYLNTVASVNSNNTVNLSNAIPVAFTSSATAGSVIAGPANDYYSTTINVYDSLGNSLPLTATFAPSSSTSGNWNIYYSINGTAATRPNTALTTPDIVFNPSGGITSGVSQTITDVPSYVTPAPSTLPDGATEPLTVSLNLNNLTQYAAPSATTAFTQNGYATGTLTSFTVDQSGRISGQYSNGQTQYIAQVALANFIAPTGLTSEGNSLYAQTFASGQPAVGIANSGNFGYITDSALEQSNVDISSQFTDMIIAQNAYVANSKVLTTENSVLAALESSVQ
jgi:flagellar hook protein FlgE